MVDFMSLGPSFAEIDQITVLSLVEKTGIVSVKSLGSEVVTIEPALSNLNQAA